jgi:hypothetical protein
MYDTHMVNVTGREKRCTHFVMFISHSFFLSSSSTSPPIISGTAFSSLRSRSGKHQTSNIATGQSRCELPRRVKHGLPIRPIQACSRRRRAMQAQDDVLETALHRMPLGRRRRCRRWWTREARDDAGRRQSYSVGAVTASGRIQSRFKVCTSCLL